MATSQNLEINLSNDKSDPIASAFLQARVAGFDDGGDDFDYFTNSATIRLIDDNTPTDDDAENEIHFTDIKSNDTNKKTATESAQQIIESQKKTIDRLNQILKENKLTLTNTINNHEIEINELRIEIERLIDENKQITELQAANIKLKQKISKYDRIMNLKKEKKLPPKPNFVKMKTVPQQPLKAPKVIKSKSVSTESMVSSNVAASLSQKLSQKPRNDANKGAQTKTNPKLKKYETMKKIGMPFQSIINKMRMDQCCDALIAEFKGEKVGIDLNDDKFSKYKKLKKINMPSASIINKMRMDGLSKQEIEAFEDEILNGNKRKKSEKKDEKSQKRELALEMGLKPKLEVKPKRVHKLKRIHWKVIELKDIKGTIWEKFAKKYTDQEIGIGAKFELQFQIRTQKPKKAALRKTRMAGLPNFGSHMQHSENRDKKSKKQRVKWLDPKRDQMIQIGLKKVDLGNEIIYDAIMDMDDKVMPLSILETLYDLLPNKTEQAKTEQKIEEIMKDDEKDDALLDCGPSEMFFVEVSAIPEVKQQVMKWLFCRTFKEIWSHRMQQATTMLRAVQAIKNSKALHEYLRVILAIGNLMNHGTDKCMAYGFNLDCLKIMDGIKDFSGKKSLAMFVYEFTYNKHPVTYNLSKELKVMQQAVRLETHMIEQSVKEMNEEFDTIDVFCRRLLDDYNEPDTVAFREYVDGFFYKNKSNMAILKTKLKNAKTLSRSVAKYYGYFDLAEDNKPEELFKIIQSFIEMMNKAKDGLFKLEKARIKLQKQRQKEREKMKKKMAKQNIAKKRKPPSRAPLSAPSKAPIKKQLSLKVIEAKVDDEDDDDVDTPLRNHFRKKTQQQMELGNRLSTTFQEKQAIAKGKVTESLRNNHIKQRSIMSGSLQYGLSSDASMDEIAKLAIQHIEDDENNNIKSKENVLSIPLGK